MCRKLVVLCSLLLAKTLFYCHAQAEKLFIENGDLNKEYISDGVTKEIIKQVSCPSVHKENHSHVAKKKKSRYVTRGSLLTDGDIYLLPHWPYYTQFFQDNDLVQLIFSFETASRIKLANSSELTVRSSNLAASSIGVIPNSAALPCTDSAGLPWYDCRRSRNDSPANQRRCPWSSSATRRYPRLMRSATSPEPARLEW